MKIIRRSLLGLFTALILIWLATILALQFEHHEYTPVSQEQRDQASHYLANKITPIPSDWQWESFEAEPGVILRTGILDVANAKGTVVFVPGFTGSIDMSMSTITQLSQNGYRVAAIEYRGQGKSYRPLAHPEKGYVQDYQLLANDLAKFARHVKRNNEPLYFFSISKGAHLTMRMAAEFDVDASAYALVVPMIKINTGNTDYQWVERSANALNAIGLGKMYAPGQAQWPPLPLKFGEANECNSNPDTAQLQSAMFALDESLRVRGTTVKWLIETIHSSHLLMSDGFMHALTQPVKIFTAGDDRLVDTDAAQQFCSSLTQCEVQHYPDARHCINREDPERMHAIVDAAVTHFESANKRA
ncbi:alpha/beta fold hydrolase [Arenicella xantha]|uniref:Alpha-beta hydrolase superfamily lysophospholipase n=1 Tax=Arenicella xantha TaxID=644221 RepID=A0A395JKE0_9GAMM|nr:alpha/beta hydrolase [Arenicella xantha]RBP51009.1 alpha-beta hydrolase superfamily lysophospholipase [Arenicella xantha]